MPSFHANKLGIGAYSYTGYSIKNLFMVHLPTTLKLPHPYALVSERQLKRLNDPHYLQSAEGKDFNRLIYESWGVITLSRVGFDAHHQHAVVYVQLTYCGLCGEGMFLFLGKKNGVWSVEQSSYTWIS